MLSHMIVKQRGRRETRSPPLNDKLSKDKNIASNVLGLLAAIGMQQ